MRVYKFLNRHFALKSMRERRLKVSRLSALNDPFEMFPFDLSHRDARIALLMTLSEMDRINGLICFSRTWANPVIWAHYADQHRGICLGFDIPDGFVREIAYKKDRESFPMDLGDREPPEKLAIMERLLFTKFEDWRYEDEMRVSIRLDWSTVSADGLFFKEWDADLRLAEVVVGLRSPTCRRELEQALHGYSQPVDFIRAAAADESFAVVRDRDALESHDDLTFHLVRGATLHPVNFVR